MTWRLWIVLSVVVVVGAWVLMVPLSPPPMMKTSSAIGEYREKGLVPKVGAFVVSEEVGHDVFETPASDAEERERVMAAMAPMPGMADTTTEAGGGAEEDEHAMVIPDDGGPAGDDEHAMVIPDDAGDAKDGHADEAHAEDAHAEGGEETAVAGEHGGPHGGGGEDVGLSVLASGSAEKVATAMRGRNVDRTVKIEMREWGYSTDLMVEPGEVIRLVVSNGGALPHEFMLMDGVGMEAVNYRLGRADWTLLEHEAIYEVPVVMPGRSFELVVEVHKPGMWMYMCMFPYHMQMGMMGMLMTAGVTMGGADAAMAAPADGLYHGVGIVIDVTPGESRLTIDHEAIAGYMGAMKMSYMVTPPSVLEGVKPGDRVRFTIDSVQRMIVDVTPDAD